MSDKDKKIEKLKRKVKKYKLLYTMAQKDLKDLVERTPSKFLSKDSEYLPGAIRDAFLMISD